MNPECFTQLEAPLPPQSVLYQFEATVADSFALIEELTKNASLTRARKLLLPKLMSGRLDVSGIALPDSGVSSPC